jgi:hypothetical protein
MIYKDGRTALTTTAFRYKLTDPSGALVQDWTTGETWTEEPAGTYYLDDAAAVPGTYYAVEPAEGEVGAPGQVPWDAPDNASAQAAAASAASADGKLTAERLALIDGAAQEATVAALPGAQVGTRIDETSTDDDGEVLGLTTASGEAVGGVRIQAFAVDAAGHIDRSSAIRQTTSRSAVETLEAEERPVGSWELYLPAGTYTLVVTLDGYYDAADGDSEITRTVTVA